MAYNKFITYDGIVALDLTSDTVTIETLAKGVTAHDKRGEPIVGIKESGEAVEEYTGAVIIQAQEEKPEEEDALMGTWIFNDKPNFGYNEYYIFNFICSDISYNLIHSSGDGYMMYVYTDNKDNPSDNSAWVRRLGVYDFDDTETWEDEAYKTITITSKLSEVENGDILLAWLQVNATKQSGGSSN